MGQKFKCALCGGTARADMVHWYLAGLVHGTKLGADMQQACQQAAESDRIK